MCFNEDVKLDKAAARTKDGKPMNNRNLGDAKVKRRAKQTSLKLFFKIETKAYSRQLYFNQGPDAIETNRGGLSV